MSDASTAAGALRRHRASLACGLLYALFFSWYTSCGGPLTEEEIARYDAVLAELGGDEERRARWNAFMRSDTGDDFAMLNALDLRDTPAPVDGVEPGASAGEVMARYVEPFFRLAVLDAAHPVLLGTAAAEALDLWGIDHAARWDQGGVVRYRSRRDVMNQIVAIAESGEDIHRFKIAALEKTIAYPLDPWFHLGDPRLVLGLVLAVIALGLHVRRLSAELRATAERPSDPPRP